MLTTSLRRRVAAFLRLHPEYLGVSDFLRTAPRKAKREVVLKVPAPKLTPRQRAIIKQVHRLLRSR